ncbi:MAG: hypothetical protein AAF798_21180 [Bacteroidota bacterium]
MIRSIFLGCFLVLCTSSKLAAQAPYYLLYDEHQSAYANGENLLSLHRMMATVEDSLLQQTYFNERVNLGKSLGVIYRLFKVTLLDAQLDVLFFLTQHEVFGHGYRFRQAGLTDNSYRISPAFPYGDGSGFARFGRNEGNRSISLPEETLMRMGGMEATTIMSQQLKDKWLINRQIYYRESLLYNLLFLDVSSYIFRSGETNLIEEPGNDVLQYLVFTNQAYGNSSLGLEVLRLNDLEDRAWVNLLNSYHLMAWYAFLKSYLWDGDTHFDLITIPIGKVEWIPAVRFGLTPFGSAIIVENDVLAGQNIWSVGASIGDGILADYWGVSTSWRKQFNDNLALTGQVAIWQQPAIELGGDFITVAEEGLGGRVLAKLDFFFRKGLDVGGHLQVGVKTAGYFEGEALEEGLILRGGVSIRSR